MERVANLAMEYHLAGGKSLEHLLRILRGLEFQIDFVHNDGKKMAGSALAGISNALTARRSKSFNHSQDQGLATCESAALFQL
jgi:hypothetical protein